MWLHDRMLHCLSLDPQWPLGLFCTKMLWEGSENGVVSPIKFPRVNLWNKYHDRRKVTTALNWSDHSFSRIIQAVEGARIKVRKSKIQVLSRSSLRHVLPCSKSSVTSEVDGDILGVCRLAQDRRYTWKYDKIGDEIGQFVVASHRYNPHTSSI